MIYTITPMDCANYLDIKIGEVLSVDNSEKYAVSDIQIIDGNLRVSFIYIKNGSPAGDIGIGCLKRINDSLVFNL